MAKNVIVSCMSGCRGHGCAPEAASLLGLEDHGRPLCRALIAAMVLVGGSDDRLLGPTPDEDSDNDDENDDDDDSDDDGNDEDDHDDSDNDDSDDDDESDDKSDEDGSDEDSDASGGGGADDDDDDSEQKKDPETNLSAAVQISLIADDMDATIQHLCRTFGVDRQPIAGGASRIIERSRWPVMASPSSSSFTTAFMQRQRSPSPSGLAAGPVRRVQDLYGLGVVRARPPPSVRPGRASATMSTAWTIPVRSPLLPTDAFASDDDDNEIRPDRRLPSFM